MTSSGINTSDDIGKLVLRLLIACLILFHGISKIISGPGMIIGIVTQHGLPAAFGYLVYVGEVIAPILVLIGLWTRIAAIVIALNMLTALLLVHAAQFFTLDPTGGWALELQAFYFFTPVAIAILGPGAYSIDARRHAIT